MKLGAINSINWARILVQITYYFYSWLRITDGLISSNPNAKVNFAVPTGNFGNILAGYYAKRMGLPIDKLVLCTNQNDVLHKFFQTGIYKRTPALLTIAPSMDISVASNFERYLYYLAKESPQKLRSWMELFEATDELTLDKGYLDVVHQDFLSNVATKSEIIETMRETYLDEKYLVCPHTATAIVAVKKLNLPKANTVVVSTAHPAKFDDAVALALPLEKSPPLPLPLAELFKLPVRKTMLPTVLTEVQSFIRSKVNKTGEYEAPNTVEEPIESDNSYSFLWLSGAALVAIGSFFYVRHLLHRK